MATYTQGCGQVGSFSYAGNFTLYVILNDRDGNSNTNKSYVDYNVYCQSNGSGSIRANHQLYFELNGQVIRNENVYVNASSPNAYIGIASGTLEVEHNSDGSKGVWFNASINATGGYGVSASRSDTFWLNQIPRYANLTSLSVKSRTINTITLQYTTDKSARLFAKLDSTNWLNNGQPFADNTTSGTFTIYYKNRENTQRLDPNMDYGITVLCRSTQSGLDTSKRIVVKTLDIARITSASNCDFGQDVNISFSNLANGTTKLTVKVGNVEICTREDLTSTYTLAFTKEELSSIIKYLKDETTEITYVVTTNNIYTNTSKAIVTLKSNIYLKRNGKWLRAKLLKKDENWKLTKIFYKFNGGWRNTK